MASVNRVILLGNLGADPVIRFIKENTSVATFSIATTESYKDKNGEWQEVTDWHNIVAWRSLAERAEKYFKKGTQVYVEGKLRTRSYDDKDGNKKYITEIVADQVFSTGKRESSEGGTNANFTPSGYERYEGAGNSSASQDKSAVKASSAPENVPIDDDLPF